MAGFDIREMMNDIDEAPGKVWFWDLEKAVIDADRCVQCGVCVAACPTDSIGIGEDDLPELVKMCTGCSLCWDFCPRGGLQYESTWKITGGSNGKSVDGMGRVEESYTARVRKRIDGVQDGGFVSALLISLLEAGEIDGALLARESATERWKGEAFLATTPEEVRACAGSFYNQTLALGHVDFDGHDLPPNPRIAVVGTPCEIEGIKAMQARPWTWGSSKVEAITLTIALLCTKSFNYEKLMLEEIRDKRNVDLDERRKGGHHTGEDDRPGSRRRYDLRGAHKGLPRRGPQGLRRVRGLHGARRRHLRGERRERGRLLQRATSQRRRPGRLRQRQG